MGDPRIALTIQYAGVVELVDSVDLGSSVFDVQVRVLSPAPRSHPDFDRVGVGFFFLIFGELPIYPVILEQIRHIRICSLKCSRYSLNDFSLLRLPNRGNRLSNTEKRSANRQNPIVRSANCWVNKKTK